MVATCNYLNVTFGYSKNNCLGRGLTFVLECTQFLIHHAIIAYSITKCFFINTHDIRLIKERPSTYQIWFWLPLYFLIQLFMEFPWSKFVWNNYIYILCLFIYRRTAGDGHSRRSNSCTRWTCGPWNSPSQKVIATTN